MSYSAKDFIILIQATVMLYFKTLVDALKIVFINWWVIFVHLFYLLVVGILELFIFSFFGFLAGGFILGLLLALVLSSYFSTVCTSVNKEKVSLKTLWWETKDIFIPLFAVLFVLFVLNTFAVIVLKSPDQLWVRASVNLIIAVLFNALPEVIYLHRANMNDSFIKSLGFIKENFIEWFLPYLIVLLPLAYFNFSVFERLSLLFLTTNPLRILEKFIFNFNSLVLVLNYGVFLILLLLFTYFMFVFRGMLYKELASSNRRKRIFQYKF